MQDYLASRHVLRPWIFRAALLLAILPAGVAQASPRSLRPTALAPGRLEQALDTVRADKIRSDTFFIASDELGGRDTPSVGQRIAARYIRARLEQLGWQPGARDGYFHLYPDRRDRIDVDMSKIVWDRAPAKGELHLGADYVLLSASDSKPIETSGSVVFCGEGGKADFAKAGVSGKWALCFDDGTDMRKLRGPAREAGAIGVILTPGPGYAGEAYEQRFAKDLESLRRGFNPSRRRRQDPEEASSPLPQMLMTGRAAAELLAATGAGPQGPPIGTDLGLTLTETRKLTGPAELENVCGFWPGSDPELAKETIVLSAHYDHVGTRNGVVYNGADDNGSGTCGLMALAEALVHYGPMRRSVMLIWVSGEEKGLWGSEAWTKDPWLPGDAKPICNINIDMIGRNNPNELKITPTKALPQYNGLVRIAEKVAPLEGFPVLGDADEYWNRSDQKNFAENLKIPVTFLFSDVHEDYHQPGDDPEKVDVDKIRRVVRMIVRMLEELQADSLDL
jgi:hypothetical protein